MTDAELRTWAENLPHMPQAVAVLGLLAKLDAARAEAVQLRFAIVQHHRPSADDRCIEDDDRLYAAAGLPPCDRRVGDKPAMLANCARFLERRTEGGGWPSYADLEAEIARLKDTITSMAARIADQSELLARRAEGGK